MKRIFSLIAVAVFGFLALAAFTRMVSQCITPTDQSSLWDSRPSQAQLAPWRLKVLSAIDPLNADYRHYRAQQALPVDPALAGYWIDSAIRVATVDPRHWIFRGWVFGSQGFFEKGIKEIDRALMLDPIRAASYAQRGIFIFQALPGMDDEKRKNATGLAEESINHALKLDGNLARNPYLAFARATFARDAGDPDGARAILKKTADSIDDDIPFLVRKWVLHFQLGDRLTPLTQWNRIYYGGRLRGADTTLLEREIRRYDVPDFRYFLFQIYSNGGQTDAARAELIALVTAKPDVAEYRMALAGIYEKEGREKDALEQYEKVLQLSPANQRAKQKVIDSYKKRKE